MSAAPSLATFEFAQVLPGGFHLPARMTVLPLADGTLALLSPIPIDEALAKTLSALGEVRFLIAPNLRHHCYLAAAIARYPRAAVLMPPGLRTKRPDLRSDGSLADALPGALTDSVEVLRIDGAPTMDEFVFYHRATRTLVVTDLVFNVLTPANWFTRLVLRVVGCHQRLGSSRVWHLLIKDKAATAAALERVLDLPFHTLVMAHGEIVPHGEDPRGKLATALRRLLPTRRALPASAL